MNTFRSTVGLTLAAVAVTGAMTLATGTAAATTTAKFGTQQTLDGPSGDIGYTVSGLKPSKDAVPVQINGKLYEATATVTAVRGDVTPLIPQFNARAADGANYPVLFQAATPQGLNPASLPQGQKSTGKLYFDVTAQKPNSVVVNNNAEDLLVWVG